MECKIYCWNARGKIYLNLVFILIMQMPARSNHNNVTNKHRPPAASDQATENTTPLDEPMDTSERWLDEREIVEENPEIDRQSDGPQTSSMILLRDCVCARSQLTSSDKVRYRCNVVAPCLQGPLHHRSDLRALHVQLASDAVHSATGTPPSPLAVTPLT